MDAQAISSFGRVDRAWTGSRPGVGYSPPGEARVVKAGVLLDA